MSGLSLNGTATITWSTGQTSTVFQGGVTDPGGFVTGGLFAGGSLRSDFGSSTATACNNAPWVTSTDTGTNVRVFLAGWVCELRKSTIVHVEPIGVRDRNGSGAHGECRWSTGSRGGDDQPQDCVELTTVSWRRGGHARGRL